MVQVEGGVSTGRQAKTDTLWRVNRILMRLRVKGFGIFSEEAGHWQFFYPSQLPDAKAKFQVSAREGRGSLFPPSHSHQLQDADSTGFTITSLQLARRAEMLHQQREAIKNRGYRLVHPASKAQGSLREKCTFVPTPKSVAQSCSSDGKVGRQTGSSEALL